VATLLDKPLLDLWILENRNTERGYNGNGDNDAWCGALALEAYVDVYWNGAQVDVL
jgi:hypothetical protein